MYRHRTQMAGTVGGAPCVGKSESYALCNQDKRCGKGPTNALLGPWSEWSTCTCECKGHHERTRTIVKYNSEDGLPASGSLKEVAPCNVHATACQEAAAKDC